MKQHILPAIKLTLLCALLFSGVYTLAIYGIAQFSPNHGEGETIEVNGSRFFANVGQSFTQDKYFNSRPSAVSYNAAASGGSNKGPSNPDYLKNIEARIDSFLVHNPTISREQIPSELVTASGSGLDPHLSVYAASIQVERIAQKRNLSASLIEQLIIQKTEKPLLGFMGPATVNVLELNLALDQLSPQDNS
jgi:potassium-transporting ATPase KdpC subunit